MVLAGCATQVTNTQESMPDDTVDETEQVDVVVDDETTDDSSAEESVVDDSVTEDTTTEASVKEIEVEAFQYSFTPSVIEVDEGDTVRLVITSNDVAHGIAIPQFGVDVDIPVGETVTADFVADKAGEYTFFCNVYCGSGHSDMRGTLIVR